MTDLFQSVTDYLHSGKDAIDLLKAAYTLLPKGEKREECWFRSMSPTIPE